MFDTLPTTPHPDTGEPFVAGDVRTHFNNRRVRYSPPMLPSKEVETEWDDDGNATAWRTLTDKEFAAATEAYERAIKEYQRTGGIYVVAGPPPVTTGRFTTASGAWAEGILHKDAWVWQSWGWT